MWLVGLFVTTVAGLAAMIIARLVGIQATTLLAIGAVLPARPSSET